MTGIVPCLEHSADGWQSEQIRFMEFLEQKRRKALHHGDIGVFVLFQRMYGKAKGMIREKAVLTLGSSE